MGCEAGSRETTVSWAVFRVRKYPAGGGWQGLRWRIFAPSWCGASNKKDIAGYGKKRGARGRTRGTGSKL
jgi:hypothetical protein